MEYWILIQGEGEERQHEGPFVSESAREFRIKDLIKKGQEPSSIFRQNGDRHIVDDAETNPPI